MSHRTVTAIVTSLPALTNIGTHLLQVLLQVYLLKVTGYGPALGFGSDLDKRRQRQETRWLSPAVKIVCESSWRDEGHPRF